MKQSSTNKVHSMSSEEIDLASTSQSTKTNMKNRIIQTVADLIIIIFNFIIFGMVYLFVDPKIAYFTCDMSEISYPYKPNTIDEWAVGLYGTVGGLLIIVLVELYNAFYVNVSKDPTSKAKSRNFFVCALHGVVLFILGISTTLLFTEIGKRWIGRLRPHFLAVCVPNYAAISCTTSGSTGSLYNSIYTGGSFCTGDASQIKQARFSFPSGHSSFSTYCMSFIIVYLEARLILVRFRFVKTFVQIAAFIAAWVTILSRVSDYWHNPTDVLGGFFIGLAVSLFITLVLGRVIWEYKLEKRIYDVDDLKEKAQN